MIDINLIRTNPELVKENIKKKFQDKKLPLVDEVIELDAKKGVKIVTGKDEWCNEEKGTLIIRSHGVSRKEFEEMQASDNEILAYRVFAPRR